MKVCLIGDVSGNLDEGMKNIAYNLYSELSKKYNVIIISPRDIFRPSVWKRLKNFEPDIVHYIPGPSIKSFIVMRIISLFTKNAKFIMSSPMPQISSLSLKLSKLVFNPNLFLVHSKKAKELFLKAGFRVKLIPISGVKSDKFVPLGDKRSIQNLRKKYGIGNTLFVVLHVGHIKRGRNLSLLSKIAKRYRDIKVVVVGSTTTKSDNQLQEELISSGVLVIKKYIERIEELYHLSDCYVFPTLDQYNSVQIPLSVLEAMGCNLPVITTKFGGLPDYFLSGHGIFLVDDEKEFMKKLEETFKEMPKYRRKLKNNIRVSRFYWNNISRTLERIYRELTGEYYG